MQRWHSLVYSRVLWLMFFLTLIGVLLVLMLIVKGEPELVSPPANAPYKNAALPVDLRVEDLLSRMTLKEKIGQMALIEKNSVKDNEDIATYGLGGLLSGSGAKPADTSPEDWHSMVSEYYDAARATRLSIPLLYGSDAIHGHGHVLGATVFPHAIGLGATGDEVLMEAVGRATAKEVAATGINWNYAPNLDLPRDIRWGRVYEAFGDDSQLVTRLGAAYTRGLLSGEQPMVASLKHFVGLGDMAWNSSTNKNFKIDQGATTGGEAQLRSTYLPPYKAAIAAGAQSVMVGLNTWDGTKIAANKYLITDVLKGELGFKGFVVSDWYGVYEIPGGDFVATVKAVNAGVDMVMLPFAYEAFVRDLTWAVRLGLVPEARIDDAVSRILRVKFAEGLFDREPATFAPEVIGSKEHRALAREAVAKSLVVLKNEGNVLPINPTVRSIRVAGSAADNVGMQSGAWTVEWQGIDGSWLPQSTSILAGIKARAGSGVAVEYDGAGNFKNSAQKAALGIAVVGETPYAEGWGDREYPILSDADLAAIARLKESSERVVVVIVSGRPLLVTGELPKWDALVAAWLPGSEGAGVADVLFGDKKFTGRLPLPWPAYAEQLPVTREGEGSDGSTMLFPRGFGL